MGEHLNPLRAILCMSTLERFDNPLVDRAPTFLQQCLVCDLVRQRVLERVFGVRQDTADMKELRGLQAL